MKLQIAAAVSPPSASAPGSFPSPFSCPGRPFVAFVLGQDSRGLRHAAGALLLSTLTPRQTKPSGCALSGDRPALLPPQHAGCGFWPCECVGSRSEGDIVRVARPSRPIMRSPFCCQRGASSLRAPSTCSRHALGTTVCQPRYVSGRCSCALFIQLLQ